MSSKPNAVHNVAVGPVAVDIFRGVTNDGHTYLYFEIARAWKAVNGSKVNRSTRFYERNEKDACAAIQKASAWIRKNPTAADEGWSGDALAKAA